jgi:hypothetical protein
MARVQKSINQKYIHLSNKESRSDNMNVKPVSKLEYKAFDSMAIKEILKIFNILDQGPSRFSFSLHSDDEKLFILNETSSLIL